MFVISIAALKRNTAILRQLKEEAGCGLVLAPTGAVLNNLAPEALGEALEEKITALAREHRPEYVARFSKDHPEASIAG